MSGISSGWNALIVFFAGIWPFLWILYEIHQIRSHMRKGRTIGGSIIAELGTLIGGPLIAIAALWIIFSIATPTLEDQGRRYAGQSQTGQILFGCLNSGGNCLQVGDEKIIPPTPQVWANSSSAEQSPFSGSNTPTPIPQVESTPPTPDPAATVQATEPPPAPVTASAPTAPDPGLFATNANLAACHIRVLTSLGFWTLTENIIEPSSVYLPAGSNWEVNSPSWAGHFFVPESREKWQLCSLDWGPPCTPISQQLAESLTGGVWFFQGKKSFQFTGTGTIPEACWQYAQ